VTVRRAVLAWPLALSSLSAGSIDLEWSAVPGAVGYRLYHGTSPGHYDGFIEMGDQTRKTVQGLDDCTDWYFAVTSLGTQGESEFSTEVAGWPKPEVRAYFSPVPLAPASGPAALPVTQGHGFVIDVEGTNFSPDAQIRLEPTPLDAGGDPLFLALSTDVLSCERMLIRAAVAPLAPGHRAMSTGAHPFVLEVQNPDRTYGSVSAALEVLLDPDRLDIERGSPATRDRIDGADLSSLARSYAFSDGDARYDPDADLDGDGIVDGSDLALLAGAFGLCRNGDDWTRAACPHGQT
jgi:hypothetical protein